MTRVPVRPGLLRWARDRAGDRAAEIVRRFPHFDDWVQGQTRPTLKQLEAFAKAACVPIGYLFLARPPVEKMPIPDFRTMAGEGVARPSPDLLDTLHICQERQAWYRDHARAIGEEPLPFVGSARLGDNVEATAADMRGALGLDLDERRRAGTWTDALRGFISQADELGVMVMVSGVVGSNNRRKLTPEEFRGFAIADTRAPLVFINGADTKSAQMFTLAHELAHIWLGESALSDVGPASAPSNRIEQWCNRVAAELLVPLAVFRDAYRGRDDLQGEVTRLARVFKVSTLVVLRRIHDVGDLSREELWQAYAEELARLRDMSKGKGGDYYLTQAMRVSPRFARAVIVSALEGETLYRDAFRMLGCSKQATFEEFGRTLGVV